MSEQFLILTDEYEDTWPVAIYPTLAEAEAAIPELQKLERFDWLGLSIVRLVDGELNPERVASFSSPADDRAAVARQQRRLDEIEAFVKLPLYDPADERDAGRQFDDWQRLDMHLRTERSGMTMMSTTVSWMKVCNGDTRPLEVQYAELAPKR